MEGERVSCCTDSGKTPGNRTETPLRLDAHTLPPEIEIRDRGRQCGSLRMSRASRVAPYSAKPRKLYGKPALVLALSRLAGLLGGGRRPERTGLAACRHLFIAITPHSAALHASQGRSVDQAPPRSGPAPPTVPRARGVQQAGGEGAWKGPATRRSRNPRPPCPYSRENEPPKSPKAHACPGRVGMTQPEPGNCGSR